MRKKIVLIVLITVLIVTGCTKENELDKKLALQKVIEDLQDAYIEKDADKAFSLIEKGTLYSENLSADQFINDFISLDIIEEIMLEKEALVKFRVTYKEQKQWSTEYIQQTAILILKLRYTDNGWLLNDVDSELDPLNTRPLYK